MYKFVTLIATECDNQGKNEFTEKVEIIIPIRDIIGFIDFPKVITKNHPIQINNRHYTNLVIKNPETFQSIII